MNLETAMGLATESPSPQRERVEEQNLPPRRGGTRGWKVFSKWAHPIFQTGSKLMNALWLCVSVAYSNAVTRVNSPHRMTALLPFAAMSRPLVHSRSLLFPSGMTPSRVRPPACLATFLALLWSLLLPALSAETNAPASAASDAPTVLLVVGAAGESEFGTNFVHQADLWQTACQTASAHLTTIGLSSTNDSPEITDLVRLQQSLEAAPKTGGDLWVVLIGHGTYDGREARFNLRGPDLVATNLAQWLRPFQRRLAILNTASASGPFLKILAGTNRVVITATRSGNEVNFTRFGSRLANALTAPQADIDQDGQISLLEAFLTAAFQVAEFYKTESRLATEHALIDDNGDGLGTPADWFRGLRATKKARDGTAVDGLRAHQMHLIRSSAENELSPEVRAKRDQLELEVGLLRDRKSALPEEEYYRQLEDLLRQLARVYYP